MGCVSGIKCLVALQTQNGKFLVVEENGRAMAKLEKHQNSEIFEVIFITLDQLQFKGYHKKYLASGMGGTVYDQPNTSHLRRNRKAEYKGNGGFAFTSIYYGKYLGADVNGALNANQSQAGFWQIFKVIKVKGKKA
jgi:hypothetical protein